MVLELTAESASLPVLHLLLRGTTGATGLGSPFAWPSSLLLT